MSTKILVIGAAGSIARRAVELFLHEEDTDLTLYLRRSQRMKNLASGRVHVVEGDAMDFEQLLGAMRGQDVVYANLAGDLLGMAKNIVAAMQQAGVKRLIFISSMGTYDEVPGQRYQSVLDPYRDAAKLVEESDLEYTIIRPHGSPTRTRSITTSRTKEIHSGAASSHEKALPHSSSNSRPRRAMKSGRVWESASLHRRAA